MPYRCVQCNTVVQKAEDQDCSCETARFVKCPIIHFMHVDGPGPMFSRQVHTKGIPGHVDDKKPVYLNLCCKKRVSKEQVSIMASLVSCPDCLAFLDTIRPPKERKPVRSLDTSKLDISEADLVALGLDPVVVTSSTGEPPEPEIVAIQ